MKKAPKIIFGLSLALVILVAAFVFLRPTDKKEVMTSKLSSSSTTSKKTKKSETSASSSSSTVSSASSQETTPSSTADTSGTSGASSTVNANSSSTSSETSSNVDVSTLYKGDFSSIAGTWSNDEGTVLTISPSGEMTMNDRVAAVTPHSEGGMTYFATFYFPDSPVGASSLIVIPAGVKIPAEMQSVPDENTVSYDRIMIGQSEDMLSHPFVKK